MPRTATTATCALCTATLTKRRAAAHFVECAPAHDVSAGPVKTIVRLRVEALGATEYWLDVEARADATLTSLDDFFRSTWLECCGHLSMFEVGPCRYVQVGAGSLDPFGRRDAERSMSTKIGAALSHVGAKGMYDYDFGSTTRLTVTLADAREGRIGRTAVRLLARNDPPAWTCGVCEEPATLICCMHETDDSPFVCAAHQASHRCPDDAFLPVVNSPRMGVCAYSG